MTWAPFCEAHQLAVRAFLAEIEQQQTPESRRAGRAARRLSAAEAEANDPQSLAQLLEDDSLAPTEATLRMQRLKERLAQRRAANRDAAANLPETLEAVLAPTETAMEMQRLRERA